MAQTVSKEVLESQPVVEPKKGKSTAFIIIIIILALLLLFSLAAGGFIFYLYSKEKNKANDLSSKVNSISTQVESQKKDKESLQSQNDLLKKEIEFYKDSLSKANQQTTNPYDKTVTQANGSYVISDSDKRIISESELLSLTPWQLKVARNEIYARHGRSFVSKDLSCYFAGQNWYKVNSNYSDSLLTNVENQNVSTILNYETKIGSPLMNYDSGC